MLILLPPSEGKTAPTRGASLDLGSLAFGEQISKAREIVLDALIALCEGSVERAAEVLDLPPGLHGEVARNRALRSAATATAARVYTGVLFEHLGFSTLDAAAKRRAGRSLLISSGLWGVVAPGDRIPAYRLSGSVNLPGVGGLARYWRPVLSEVLPARAGNGLVLDLRSGTYAAAWRPTGELAGRTVAVQVTSGGKVVSHFNKATKGLLARAVLSAGIDPRTPEALAAACRDLGFAAVLGPGSSPKARTLVIETG